MPNLQALTVEFITGVSSFTVVPNFFYRVDASAGAVTAQLPLSETTDGTDWNIIKKVDSSANPVNITPTLPDQINQTTVNVLSSQNQSHNVFPGAPTGNLLLSVAPAAGTDIFGNAYPAGLKVYNGLVSIADPASIEFPSGASFEQNTAGISSGVGGPALAQFISTEIEGASTTGAGAHDRVILSLNSAAEDNSSSANMQGIYVHSNGNVSEYWFTDETGMNILAGSIVAIHPGTTPAVPETWTTLTLINGFSAGTNNGFTDVPQVRLMADNMTLQFKGTLVCPNPPTGVTFANMPSGYPNANLGGPYGRGVVINLSGAQVGYLELHNNGNLQLQGGFTGTPTVALSCIVPTQ